MIWRFNTKWRVWFKRTPYGVFYIEKNDGVFRLSKLRFGKTQTVAKTSSLTEAKTIADDLTHYIKHGKYPNPGRQHIHTAKWRRLAQAIKRRSGGRNRVYSPYAVATARLGPSRLNPFSSKTKRRALRVGSRLAYRIWQHVKSKGYALPVPKRTPKLVKEYAKKILKANGINWTIKNPPDKTAARELELYVTNDGELYRQETAIIKNLMRKIRKGVFRKHLAARLFMYLVENGARKYVKEFGGPHDTVKAMFPKRTRLRVARSLTSHFLVEARLGNYDNASFR